MAEEVEPSVPAFSGHRFYRQNYRGGGEPIYRLTPKYVSYLKSLPPSSYLQAIEDADHWLRLKVRKASIKHYRGRDVSSTYRPFFGDLSFFQSRYINPSDVHSSGYVWNPTTHRVKYYI